VESGVKMRVISADASALNLNLWGEIVRYRALLANLVVRDLRLKYRDAFLGFLWSLVLPLFTMLVYYVAFDLILHIGVPNFIAFLVAGLLSWNFFAASVTSSTTVIVDNASLLRKVAFPSQILPVSRVLFHFVQFLLGMLVFLPVILFLSNIQPAWEMLSLLPLLAMHALFTIGVVLALSVVATLWRDVKHLTEMILPLLFWMTPIVYPLERAPEPIQVIFQLSPLAAYAIAYQDILVRGRLPSLEVMASIVAWAIVSLMAGYAIFRRYSTRLVEEL
jgi:ABC-2 type transport system permease protein